VTTINTTPMSIERMSSQRGQALAKAKSPVRYAHRG
jgi:hypothetical protein